MRAVVDYCRGADASHVPTLRRVALSSPDPLVTGNALRALGRLGAVRPSDPELAGLLDDPRPRVRQEVVIALGESADPASVDLLAPLLRAEPASLRPLVLQALGRIGTREARAALDAYAPRASEDERPFLRAALEAAGS